MKVSDAPIAGLKIVQLDVHGDARGFFVERFHLERFAEAGLAVSFVQDNHSRSAPGVLRGLHYQYNPEQGKLVGVTRGRVWDVAVDLRPGSPTYGEHFGMELSGENGRLLWMPSGFAHGFCVLGDELADMLYKVTGLYNAEGEGGIRYDDPELAVKWPVDIQQATVSARDAALPSFAEYRKNPPLWKG